MSEGEQVWAGNPHSRAEALAIKLQGASIAAEVSYDDILDEWCVWVPAADYPKAQEIVDREVS